MKYWIAIVDDEPTSLQNARLMLNESGMKTSCLRSGKDLLKFVEKNDPDLVLLDIMMPEMDGFATFSALRVQCEELGKTVPPVIFLTGANDSEIERRGLKAGASDFIHKPFNRDIISSRILNTIENRKLIESLTEEATLDKLTGFFNKTSGTKMISDMCLKHPGSLTILDLDCFKLVNDIYGHDMGDRVLEAFSDIIRHNIRTGDVVSRIGGDEFLGFFRDITTEVSVASISQRLNEQLVRKCEELMGDDFDIPIGISSGVVFVPEFGTTFKKLFPLADSALYSVKQNGKHGYGIYSPQAVNTSKDENLATEMARISQLVEERGVQKGAMLLGQDAFAFNYRFIIRFSKRYKGCAVKLLFALSCEEPNYDISDAADAFGEILKASLRKSDIIMQNRKNKFFLLLPDMLPENVPSVTDRILSEWDKSEFSEIVLVRFVTESLSF